MSKAVKKAAKAQKKTDPNYWVAKMVKKAAKKARRDDPSSNMPMLPGKKVKKIKIKKAAYDAIGLGFKQPPTTPRPGEGDNRPTLAGGTPMAPGAGTTLSLGYNPKALDEAQLAQLTANTQREHDFARDISQRSRIDPGFAERQRYEVGRIKLNPLDFSPILTADLADKLTPTASSKDADTGSRSGSGRRRTSTRDGITTLTDKS